MPSSSPEYQHQYWLKHKGQHTLKRRIAALEAEVGRLQAGLRHIGDVAESAALGRAVVDHWWYGEEVFRLLGSDKVGLVSRSDCSDL